MIGDRSVVAHARLGRAEDQARGLAVGGARRFELLQRAQPAFGRGQLLLLRAGVADAPVALDARRAEARLGRLPRRDGLGERGLRCDERLLGA